MYVWLCDVVQEQGPNMNKQLGKTYLFRIRDADDVEVPITLDFSGKEGQIFVGSPDQLSKDKSTASEIYLSEKDFHALLDKELSVPQALLKGRIRVGGGMSGLKNAQQLVSSFLKPYMIDTWGEAQTEIDKNKEENQVAEDPPFIDFEQMSSKIKLNEESRSKIYKKVVDHLSKFDESDGGIDQV